MKTPEYKLEYVSFGGCKITKDGHIMFAEDILKDLKSLQHRIAKLKEAQCKKN